jgi:anti-sigma regulatory factor (Ser/Thr protein kinase)
VRRVARRSASASRGARGGKARLTVAARIENLPQLLALVDGVCREHRVAPDAAYDVRLAVDEICSNLIVHGYRDLPPGPISLAVMPLPDRLVIHIADRGRAFNPANAPVPDLSAPVDTRPLGGLGCHLVRSVMDAIDYESDANGENRLTLTRITGARQ